jgi:hypothetical protein
MTFRITTILFAFAVFHSASYAKPNIVQSLIVEFPKNGKVIVQAREENGKFPSMLFVSQETGKVLLNRSAKDSRKSLIPEKDTVIQPEIRFSVIRSTGFPTPLIMAVTIYPGGSNAPYFLTIFGEMENRIEDLVSERPEINEQGGFYLGYVNQRFGYGLVVWNFILGHARDEYQYSSHRYKADIYTLKQGKFKQVLHRISRRRYWINGEDSLKEIGIRVHDQRKGIPVIKDTLHY